MYLRATKQKQIEVTKQITQESTENKVERQRRMWREASKKLYYNNKKYRKNKNKSKRDIENCKARCEKDASFRTKRLDYLLNRYRTEPEFREKSLIRSNAWRDERK